MVARGPPMGTKSMGSPEPFFRPKAHIESVRALSCRPQAQAFAREDPQVVSQHCVFRRVEVLVEVAVEPLSLRAERPYCLVVEPLQIPRLEAVEQHRVPA